MASAAKLDGATSRAEHAQLGATPLQGFAEGVSMNATDDARLVTPRCSNWLNRGFTAGHY